MPKFFDFLVIEFGYAPGFPVDPSSAPTLRPWLQVLSNWFDKFTCRRTEKHGYLDRFFRRIHNQHTWIFQMCKICAFSPKKPTKRIFTYLEDPGMQIGKFGSFVYNDALWVQDSSQFSHKKGTPFNKAPFLGVVKHSTKHRTGLPQLSLRKNTQKWHVMHPKQLMCFF